MVTVALPIRADQPLTDLELGTVTQALRRLPGVAQVRVLAAQDVGRLVQPWLGSDATLAGLPLPRLIEVAYEPGFRPDPTDAARRACHGRTWRHGRPRDGRCTPPGPGGAGPARCRPRRPPG